MAHKCKIRGREANERKQCPYCERGVPGGSLAISSVGFTASLDWRKGPAEGGTGTAPNHEDGTPQWYDGDRLLIIVETTGGRDVAVVDISADEDHFRATDASSGDEYDAWAPADWSWWAKLTNANLPPND